MDSAHHPALQRRGNRPTRQAPSCSQCQQRKIKCDRKFPCNRCTRGKRAAACSYAAAPAADGNGRPDDAYASSAHDGGGGFAARQAAAHVDVTALARKVADLEEKVRELSSGDGRAGVPRDAGPEGGVFRKGRFFGRSHWMCLVDEFPGVAGLNQAVREDADARALLERCKRLARELKARTAAYDIRGPRSSVAELVPSRDVADQLVDAYLRTFETVFRIFHVPSFMLQYRQYWDDPQAASEIFIVQLLLILAIGTCFGGQQSFESLRSSTAPWVYAASAWLHSPVGASLITIPAVQTRCLMLLARQTSSIGLGQIWGSAGSLLNTAMQLGLHRSPTYLPGTGALEAELRRRLWATVAELVVQTSIDAGAAPIFSHDDFDCEPPSNIDDDQLHEDTAATPTPKPLASFTQTTTQILLLQSLPARLEIAKHLNHFRSDGSYSTTLQLHAKLSNVLPPQSMTIVPLSRPSSSAGNEHASPFQAKLLTLLTQRFLLALHQHFALQAHKDPTFHFSRTACLTTSLVLLSLSKTDTSRTVLAAAVPSPSTCIEDTFALLTRRASGIFREGTLRPAIAICLELVALVSDHEHHCSFLALGTDHTSSTEQQRRAIESFVELARERVRVAGDSFKTYVVFFVILAIVGAVEKGEERMDWLVKAAVKESLEVCLGLLRERLHECGGGMSDIAVSPTETTQRDEVTAECSVSIEGWEEMLGWLGADSEFSFDPTFPDTGDVMQGLSGAF